MTAEGLPLTGLVACVGLLIAAGWAYSTRYRLPRPPIGTFTYPDMLVIFAVVVAAPLAYLNLPAAVVATLFGLVLLGLARLALRPVVGGAAAWVGAGALCAATAAAALLHETALTAALTDLLLGFGVVAVAVLWAQGGMRSGHVALLSALLAGYDLIGTALTGTMQRLLHELAGLPFTPIFQLSTGPAPVSVGLGDLLVLVVYPLVAHRSYGRRAALIAAGAGVAVTAVVAAGFGLRLISSAVPLLTVLGPLVVAQDALWQRACRSTVEDLVQVGVPAHGNPH